ncbi:MAG TPA: hypothetical protein VJN39_02615 [Gemmatimonadales bacterium]|nr:hypothetical protein [Gemmatimonadales bacterium]
MDSVIEVTSGVLLWWRLRAELGSALLGPAVERRAEGYGGQNGWAIPAAPAGEDGDAADADALYRLLEFPRA